MNKRSKWFVLLILLLLIGGVITTVGVIIWERSQKTGGIRLDKEREKLLKRRLAEKNTGPKPCIF